MKAIDRLFEYIESKGIRHTRFEKELGLSNGYLKTQQKRGADLGESVLLKIIDYCLDINPIWLLTGKEEMIKDSTLLVSRNFIHEEPFKGGAPFYEDLQVSAGNLNVLPDKEEKPTGFIKIPGVNATQFFPVIGCSMEPKVFAGDIIGVNALNRWDRIDPDRIYMIITYENRMIKHLRTDNDREDILWCISPNFKEFPMQKEEIRTIFQVVFIGRLA